MFFCTFLIKENHIAAAGGIREAIVAARHIAADTLIEIEVETLEEIDAWSVVEQTPGMNVLPSMWAFKSKRYPHGLIKSSKLIFLPGETIRFRVLTILRPMRR